MEDQEKLLVIGPAWVGDMVMAQTFFKLLRERKPKAFIDVLAPAWSQSLLERMPEIDHGRISPFGHGQLRLRDRYRLGVDLRKETFDQAFVLRNSFKSAFVPFWARIPRRTGWLGEQRWGVLNDVRRLNKKKLPLMIQRFAALALEANAPLPEELPKPRLSIDSNQVMLALEAQQLSWPESSVLALCPGAEFGPSKRWPSSHYAAIASEKLEEGWNVWIFGSAKDNEVAEEIQSLTNQRCVNLAGKTSLSEAVDLMSLASAVVTNDSGLMHIAAALNRPLVALYGSSSPLFTPPLSDQATISSLGLGCSPCFRRTCPLKHQRCLQELSPSLVSSALAALDLQTNPG